MVRRKEKENIDFRYNLRVYWNIIKKHKLLMLGILFFILIIESTIVADKFIFKVIIDDGTLFAAGSLLPEIFIKTLITLAAIFISIVIVRVVSQWLWFHFINLFETKIVFDLKRKYFNHIIHLSHDFHTSHKTGSLISRLVRGGNAIESLTDIFVFNFIPLIFQLTIVVIALLQFDKLSALVVLLMAFIFILYSVWMNNIQKVHHIRFNNAEDYEKANISDTFTNIDSVKYFGKEENIKRRFKKITQNTLKLQFKFWGYTRWFDAGQNLIMLVGVFFLILFPLLKFLDGNLTIGTLVFIYTIYGNLVGPLFGFVHGIRNFYRSMGDLEHLSRYGKIHNEIKDHVDSKDLKIKHGKIEFDSVTFGYKKRKIFNNFNLEIPENYKVALVGHSGSGKSTLIKLLYRMYDLNKGLIKIDKKDIKDFKQESLRSELSIVPQECVLFDDTIYNNIKFSKPGATRQEVMKAMKFAQLDKVVKEFPFKEHTIVGERGVKLSGGEKQRVSIARALLANKKVLVLDEATSSLDSQTEHEIQSDLEKLMQGRTSIIIAHRLSTIMKADMIVVLEKGKIAQIGKHNQLIKKPGIYKKLWHLQKGGYIK